MQIRNWIRLFTLMQIRIRIQILAAKLTLQKVLKYALIPYILACHLQINADLDPVLDTAYHFDADSDFYLMLIWMRIHVTKIMLI